MPSVGAAGAPNLSKIESWDTEHLLTAAKSWIATATLWEDSFNSVYQGALRPGGTVWEGQAAEAAQGRAFADLIKVRGLSDRLTEAAGIARRGADTLDYLKRDALDAVEQARGAGFAVGEDLSVSDNSLLPVGPALAARQAQAQAFAADIHTRAAALSLADNEIAANIAAAVAPLSEMSFAETPTDGHVQLVGARGIKEGPPIPDPGLPGDPVGKGGRPSAADITGVTKGLPEGNKPTIKLVQTPEQLRDLFKWASQNGVEVPDAYGSNAGSAYTLPDGTRIGLRDAAGSTRQPVIDIKYPDGTLEKVHVNPAKGGVPKLPTETPLRPPPEASVPSKGFPGEPVPRGFGGMPFPPPGMPTFVPPPLPEPETDPPTLGEPRELPGG